MANDHGNADNYTRPQDKARWGFGGTADKIELGQQTVAETPEQGTPKPARSKKGAAAAQNNGGGKPGAGDGTSPPDDLTIDQVKARLDAKGIEYAADADLPTLQDLLKANQA